MGIISLNSVTILVLCVTSQFSIVSNTNTSNLIGFSSYLVHRDSLEAPLNQSHYVANAIHRSKFRLSHFENVLKLSANNGAGKNEAVNSVLVASGGEYLIEMFVGTPPVRQLAIADTGSDITWTQCFPCRRCYKQNQPFFNPKRSSSYRKLSCGSSACQTMTNEVLCRSNSSTCQYRLSYGDRSTSIGDLAIETFNMGGIRIPKMLYGCSYNNQGTFDVNTAGIFGLGGGYLSFVGQLRDLIGGRFSYCLTSFRSRRSVKSKISFGFHAIVSGHGVVTTPVLAKRTDTFYYLILEAISVGKMRLILFNAAPKTMEDMNNVVEEGNIIIDTGTTLTYLPAHMYRKLEYTLRRMIKAKPVRDPQRILGLCYPYSKNFRIPTITFHFAHRAYLTLPRTSVFVRHNNLLCLAMAPAKDLAVFGNLAQMNFKVGYDLMNGKISFQAADCSKN